MAKNTNRGRRAAQAANAGRRKRRRRSRRVLHYMLLTLFLLGTAAVLCLGVFFKIEAVTVVGTDKYDPEEVAQSSGIVLGENLWRLDKRSITRTLMEKYPYIESLEIVRKPPGRVELHITQSRPAGAIRDGDDYVLIAENGKILERGVVYIPERVPLVIGLDTGAAPPGTVLGTWEKEPVPEGETELQKESRELRDKQAQAEAEQVSEALVMLGYLYKAMEASGFTDITNVDVSDRLNMVVRYENRLWLELGSEADLVYKLEFLRTVVEEKLPSDARGTLFAGDVGSKKRVHFRPEAGYTLPRMEDSEMLEVSDEQDSVREEE